ncbi:MAG: replication-relaxation family protein, partial [Solirubrobacteraceae bacterium]
DALFAHRVLFATASAADARSVSALLMSEFSDQIRGGDEQLARLFSPDVRLHLPRHTALASWTTPGGRERPFIATTIPLSLDRERIDWHTRAQHARGGRELRDPAPPPDLFARPKAPALSQPPPAAAQPGATAAPPSPPPASYRELLALDGAARLRLLAVAAPARAGRLAPADRELLVWLAGARIALSSQIHRRLHPESSLTVTQRQLKRLADAGLLARFQLHREDGGGTPLCCAPTQAAIDLLGLEARRAPELRPDALPGLRADVHIVGWLLALEARAGDSLVEVLGPGRAAIVPGLRERSGLDACTTLRARDFLATARDGSRAPVERFAAVRPSAVASLRSAAAPAERCDLLVVADAGDQPAWLEAYDHLLAGWWRSVERYRRAGRPPVVVIVCGDRAQALARVAAADAVLSATLAQIGVEPSAWERGGRAGIHFAAEEDLHHGLLHAWRVPLVPPSLRGDETWNPLRVSFAQLPPEPNPGATKPPWR